MVATILTATVSVSKSVTVPLQFQTNIRPRLSIADSWSSYNYREPSGRGTYSFGYDIDDPATNNVQFRNEERHPNGTVSGSYGYVDPDGNVRVVNYVADGRGYRATEEKGFKLSMLKPIPLEEYSPFFPALTSARSKPLPSSTVFALQRSPQVILPPSKAPEQDQRIGERPLPPSVTSLVGTGRKRFNTLPAIVVNTPPHQDRGFVLFNQPDNVPLSEDLYEPNSGSGSEFDDDHYLQHDPPGYFPGVGDASELGFRFQDQDFNYYNRGRYFGEPRRFPQRNH